MVHDTLSLMTYPNINIFLDASYKQQAYVLGFLIERNDHVLLVKKNRPLAQRGLLNGVGGKIEPGETHLNAMIREFKEKTGLLVQSWHHFCVIDYVGAMVYCFVAEGSFDGHQSLTDEEVVPMGIYNLRKNPEVTPDVKWLVPLAYSHLNRGTEPCEVRIIGYNRC